MQELRHGSLQVSGVEITLSGREDDLYFRNALAEGFVYEPAVAAADLLLNDAPVVLDVGASIGAVTAAVSARRPNARIVSFEANPAVHESLRATVASLAADVTIVDRAVGAAPGELSFHQDANGSAWGFLSEELGSTTVPVVTIDDTVDQLNLGRVDLIKIDIEGGELPALQGAEATIRRYQPIVVFEVNVFCLWRYGRTLPQDLFAWVMDRYPHLTALHADGSVTPIAGPDTVNHLLFVLGTQGGLLDVCATAEPHTLDPAAVAGYATPTLVEPPAAQPASADPPPRGSRRFWRR